MIAGSIIICPSCLYEHCGEETSKNFAPFEFSTKEIKCIECGKELIVQQDYVPYYRTETKSKKLKEATDGTK